MSLTYFSICSANYMPLVRTLHASLTRAEPEAKFVLFLADELSDTLNADKLPFEVVEARALNIQTFADMAFRYDIMELNTAIKPFCFLHLLARNPGSQVVYLDPDIYVTEPLGALQEILAGGAELVLTPHALTPLDDGYDPDDRRIMQTGAYNLGFAAIADTEQTRHLLGWWADHMRTRCVNDLPGGVFVDQKFMDFAPAFVERTHILRHPGYNVAYWNLHERQVIRTQDGWKAGGEPLVFFHFSGVDRKDSEVFSRHQNRFSAESAGDARLLLEAYRSELASLDEDMWKRMPYAYGAFGDGQPISEAVRKAYRRVHKEPRQASLDELFVLDEAFFLAPSEGLSDHSGAPISRIMHEVWRLRADLRQAFNLRRKTGRQAYAAWFAENGGKQTNLPTRLVPTCLPQTVQENSKPITDEFDQSLPEAVLAVGYLQTESGLGEAARTKVDAMRGAGVDVRVHPIRAGGFHNTVHSDGKIGGSTDARVLYLHVNADQTIRTLSELPAKLTRGRYKIGYWAWELPTFPKHWAEAADQLDEIWVPSRFVRDAVSKGTDKQVTLVPHAVVPHIGDREAGRASLGVCPDTLVVTAVFDTRSFLSRKNPMGALEAFRQAFPDPETDKTVLVLKSHGPLDQLAAQKLFARAASSPGVIVRHEVLTGTGMSDLMEATDVLLSTHRAEGFGLNIANAMARGKLAVATGWSGNMDFMDEENSVPLPYTLRPLAPGDYPFAEGQHWAEPDLKAAAEALRKARADQGWRMALGAAAAEDLRRRFGAKVVGKLSKEQLARIFG